MNHKSQYFYTVFERDNESQSISYKYSLDDKDASNSFSISALSCCKLDDRTGLTIASGSNQGLKVWRVSDENDKSMTGKHKATLVKISKKVSVVNQTEDEHDDESDQESEDKKTNVNKSNDTPPAKESSKCSIQ